MWRRGGAGRSRAPAGEPRAVARAALVEEHRKERYALEERVRLEAKRAVDRAEAELARKEKLLLEKAESRGLMAARSWRLAAVLKGAEKAVGVATQQKEAAVAATPWVSQFKMSPSYGVGEVSDPYVRACRAECMLAVIVLHVDGHEVDFIDEERIEVLRDAAPAETMEAVRKAAKAAIEDAA